MIELTYYDLAMIIYGVGLLTTFASLLVPEYWGWLEVTGSAIIWPVLVVYVIAYYVVSGFIDGYYYARYGESRGSFTMRQEELVRKLKYYDEYN